MEGLLENYATSTGNTRCATSSSWEKRRGTRLMYPLACRLPVGEVQVVEIDGVTLLRVISVHLIVDRYSVP
jgi:hypothetical protein